MGTINDVLNFLNQMEIYNILTGVELSTFNIIRKFLTVEFENIDLDKLVEMLKTLDDLYIEYLRMKVFFDKSLITTLRNKIFEMYDQKLIRDEGQSDSDQQFNIVCDRIYGCKNKRTLQKNQTHQKNDKSKKYILRGQRNARYHEKNIIK